MGLKMNSSMEESLKLAQGPLLCNEEYIGAVEAAVVAAGKGAGKGELGKDWGAALKRLLVVRRNPPLALWWAFSCVEGGVVGSLAGGLEEASGLVSSASSLLHSLKSFSVGNVDRETAIAVLAPVLGAIFQVTEAVSRSVGMLGRAGLPEAGEGVGKKRRKIAKRVRDLIREVRCFVVFCERWEVGLCDSGPPLAPEFRMAFSSILAVNGVKKVVPHPVSFVKFPVCARARRALAGGEEVSGKTLAGIICAEVVLLQLLVEIIDWRSRLKKQKKDFESGIQELIGKLKHIAVHAAAAAGSSGGLDGLLEMLLDHHLPVGDVLDAQEEAVLRGVLYEAVLVEPPFTGKSRTKLTTQQQPITFLRKLAVARLAVAWFRSKNEGSRAAAVQEKVMLTMVPPHFLEWAKALDTDRKPSSGLLRDNKSVLGWLMKSMDDASFKKLLEEQDKTVACLDVFDAVEAGSRKDMFFYDRQGEPIESREEEELALEDADRAFASAANSIKQSEEPVAGRKPSEEVNESASDSSDDEGEADDEMEDDDAAEKPSSLKRPRQEPSSTAILLSSGEESDDVTEISGRKAKKLRRGEGEVLRGESDKDLTSMSIEDVKDQVQELESTELGAEVEDTSTVDLTDAAGQQSTPKRQGDVSSDVGRRTCESPVVVQDQSSSAVRGSSPNKSRLKAEDVTESHGTNEGSTFQQGEDAGQETSVDLTEESTPVKLGRVTRKGGSTPKSSKKTASKQNGGPEVVVTPRKIYMTRAKQEAEEASIEKLMTIDENGGDGIHELDKAVSTAEAEGQEVTTTSREAPECSPENTSDAHGDVSVSIKKRKSPRSKRQDQSVTPLPSSRKASQAGAESPAPSMKEGPVPVKQDQDREKTPEPVPGSDGFATPLTGTRRRKRQAEIELPDQIEPRVTRSGRVLGLTPTVERSSKKGRKGKPLNLEPLLDTTAE